MPDVGDLEAYVRELNTEYYEGDPAAYLRTRLAMQVALADPSHPLAGPFSEGFTFAEITVHPTTFDDADVMRFLTLDVVALAYSASETLLRQFAAHVSMPTCPWLEISSLTDGNALRRLAAEIEGEDPAALLERARPVLRGSVERPADVDDDRWEEDGEALVDLLKVTASRFLSDSPVNNALKHGLAILATTPALRLGLPDDPDGPALDVSGPAVKYVRARTRSIEETTAFVPLESSMRYTGAAIDQVTAIYNVGRARYLHQFDGMVPYLTSEHVKLWVGLPTGTHLTGLRGLSWNRTLTFDSN